MIGFNYLGKMGQLGNQMFQYASLRGIAKNRGYDFCIPYHNEVFDDGIGNKLRIELFNPFVMSNVTQSNIAIVDNGDPRTEGGHNFNETLFNTCPDNVSLHGYFQSEKYFKHIEDEIRQDFTFKNEIAVICKHRMSTIHTPIALHIRRGDFLINSANHYNLSLDYYEKALNHFDDSRPVLILSDDPEWCKKQELFVEERFLIAEGNDSYTDLCLMSLCSDFIIANSSFSWWGAWLSKAKDKKVIAPAQWFGPNNAHLDTSDLFPSDWIIINDIVIISREE